MSESQIAVTEGSGKNVSTVQVSISGNTRQIERDIQGMGEITLATVTSTQGSTGLYPASAIEVRGRYYIILKNTFNDDQASASIRFYFFDSGDTPIGYSEIISISNLGKSAPASRYWGDIIVFANIFGAKSFQVSLEAISSGDNISIDYGVT
jgi:hypothetical protein